MMEIFFFGFLSINVDSCIFTRRDFEILRNGFLILGFLENGKSSINVLWVKSARFLRAERCAEKWGQNKFTPLFSLLFFQHRLKPLLTALVIFKTLCLLYIPIGIELRHRASFHFPESNTQPLRQRIKRTSRCST